MNFVIVSPLFYPQKNAEAYCATRFASALANAGHEVWVITDEYHVESEEGGFEKLVHPELHIVRIPNVPPVNEKWPYFSLRCMMVLESDTRKVLPYVVEVRKVLKCLVRPILITRSYPWFSVCVGWRCRQYATKWIQHFSDPMLDWDPWCNLAYFRMLSLRFWMKRVMRYADAVSITCKRVQWFYREKVGACVDEAHFILATHIGDFKLTDRSHMARSFNGIIFHDGDIYGGRGMQIIDAVGRLNAKGIKCEFIQGRPVADVRDRQKILSSPYCSIIEDDVAVELRDKALRSQISFVADFNEEGLAYSVHLMSKFVYQLFTDKPIVVLSKLESEKHDYCVRFPTAGLFFADMAIPESLDAAIEAALAVDPNTIDRCAIRQEFSEEKIASVFVEEIERLKLKK